MDGIHLGLAAGVVWMPTTHTSATQPFTRTHTQSLFEKGTVLRVPSSVQDDDSITWDSGRSEQWLVRVKEGHNVHSLISRINTIIQPYQLSEYMGHHTHLLVAPETVAARLLHPLYSHSGVVAVVEYHPSLRIHPSLQPLVNRRHHHSSMSNNSESVEHIRVMLAPPPRHATHQSHDDAVWLAKQWASNMPTALGLHPNDIIINAVNERRVRVSMRWSWMKGSVISWLSNQVEAHWIEAHQQYRLLNSYARYVIQSDFEGYTPIWNHSINGEGQIIAHGDTGVDYDSCFFADPLRPLPLNRVDMSHRKIVSYNTVAGHGGSLGPGGDTDGHGTHTAGSIAAEVMSESREVMGKLEKHNGMAYRARLAVFDFQNPESSDLFMPDDIYNDYFKKAYDRSHARISSNSWGDDNGNYDSYASDVDRFVQDHPEFVVLFAAGNAGQNGWHSLAAPGIAKNVLSVGSTLNTPSSFYDLGYASGLQFTAPPEWRGVISATPSLFGPEFFTMRVHQSSRIVVADPVDGCNPLSNAGAVAGNIVIMDRGACQFTQKMTHAQDAGAVLCIVVNNEAAPPVPMSGPDPDGGASAYHITIPSVMVSRSDGAHLKGAQVANVRLTWPAEYISAEQNQNHVSSFSGRGPTIDGRLKPDVLAPGEYVVSIKSDHRNDPSRSCPTDGSAVTAMQGTSMATPITAGAAALVRQYFIMDTMLLRMIQML